MDGMELVVFKLCLTKGHVNAKRVLSVTAAAVQPPGLVPRTCRGKLIERDFGNAAYATIRGFVLKFEDLGLLSAQKYGNRVKYSIVK